MSARETSANLGQLLRDFFLKHLSTQVGASPRTIESYRDAFRLLFHYSESEGGRRPTQLELSDIDAPLVIGFLDWLEKKRGNAVRSRNARLAALKSFMNFAAGHAPACLPSIQRVLALPTKRWEKPMLGFLSREEVDALLAEPQRGTWIGERDYMFLSIAYNTGARVSELVALTIESIDLERRCVRIIGKGRKLREVPLWDKTTRALRTWLRHCGTDSGAPVFPTRAGQRMTRSNVEKRMARMVRRAAQRCPSLTGRRVTPHTLRHTTAMHLLQSGVDITVIALWLGHADPVTTHGYIEADLNMKERALSKLPGPRTTSARFRPTDRMLAFLKQL